MEKHKKRSHFQQRSCHFLFSTFGLKSYLSWYGRAPHEASPWWCYACLWALEWLPGGWLSAPPPNTRTHTEMSFKCWPHKTWSSHISHGASLSPVRVAEFSAPPSLTDARPSDAPPRPSDTSWAPPPRPPAPPPAAAAAPAALARTPPPVMLFPDGASPSVLSLMLCMKWSKSNCVSCYASLGGATFFLFICKLIT